MRDYLNSNGLVSGNIPAGEVCRFSGACPWVSTCPVPRKAGDYSCARARLASMVQCEDEQKKLDRLKRRAVKSLP
jgi:hypothetical protein